MTASILILALVFGPMLAALAVPALGRRSARLRDVWVLAVTGMGVIGAVVMCARIRVDDPLDASLPFLVGELQFHADHFGVLFALFSAFVWFSATLYASAYMRTQHAPDRYHAVALVVLGAMFGVVLAADLVTLFLFFETLGLTAFLLVIHTGTPEARRAAIQYFWMTILGGVALLAGIMLVYSLGGGTLAGALPPSAPPRLRAAAAVLMTLGFGVKAGMVPVHFWLPNAHPVAPTPASALLSGVMIKAGAYGIFRSVSAVFRPEQGAGIGDAAWAFATQFGLVVTWLGIATMALGVVLALGQANAKRMLAYHSISQMGFILAGLGAGAYLAGDGGLGTAGGLLHTVNHALFKASLFLGVGAVAYRTGNLDMYALGGLWRRMPLTFVLMLVAAAGITGLPLFNGYVSKSMIHHALEAAAVDGGVSLRIAERVFLLTAAGTAASFIKLIGLVFLGRSKLADPAAVREAPVAMLLSMALLAVPVMVLGWRPHLLLEGLIMPGLAASGTSTEGVAHYLGHYFLGAGDTVTSLGVFALGGAIFAAGMRLGWFHLHLPAWLGFEYWFQRTGRRMVAVFGPGHGAPHPGAGRPGEHFLAGLRGISQGYELARQHGAGLLGALLLSMFRLITLLYGRVQQRLAWGLRAGKRRFMLGLGEAGLARRRLVESVFVGVPGSPVQAMLDAAWGALEQERYHTVRAALAAVARDMPPAADEAGQEARVESVRVLATMMASAVFEVRLDALGELARGGGEDAVRSGLAALHRNFQATRGEIVRAAVELAEVRLRGADIAQALAARLDPVLAREARVAAGCALEAIPQPPLSLPDLPKPRRARRRHAVGAWLRDMARLAIAELRQSPSSWPKSESLDTDPRMLETKRGIQRYARDVALNVAATFLVMLLLAAAVWFGA